MTAPLSPQWRQVSAAFSVAAAAREVRHVVGRAFDRSFLSFPPHRFRDSVPPRAHTLAHTRVS